MSPMAHPIHLHGQQFQILESHIDKDHAEDYATVREGFVVSGWKDTVLVTPGERVRSMISRACSCITATTSNMRTWA